MELLGDVGHVEGRFDSFGTVNLGEIGAQFVLNVPWAWKSFWAYPMELLGNMGQIACFGHLEVLLILTQDRCTVCAKCTIGLEISLDAPDCTPT
jgi:hypothetical protein